MPDYLSFLSRHSEVIKDVMLVVIGGSISILTSVMLDFMKNRKEFKKEKRALFGEVIHVCNKLHAAHTRKKMYHVAVLKYHALFKLNGEEKDEAEEKRHKAEWGVIIKDIHEHQTNFQRLICLLEVDDFFTEKAKENADKVFEFEEQELSLDKTSSVQEIKESCEKVVKIAQDYLTEHVQNPIDVLTKELRKKMFPKRRIRNFFLLAFSRRWMISENRSATDSH